MYYHYQTPSSSLMDGHKPVTIDKDALLYIFLSKPNANNINNINKKLDPKTDKMEVRLYCPDESDQVLTPWYDVDISSVVDLTHENAIN